MAATQPTPTTINTNQITTANLAGPVEPAPTPPSVDDLYGKQGPDPQGTKPESVKEIEKQEAAGEDRGVESEEVIWEARYSMKNFIGRLVLRSVLTVAWIALAIYTWGYRSEADLAPLTILLGIALLLYWLGLIYRVLQARFGHYYRLTTKRLFVSSGVSRRHRDQMELLYLKDVSTIQSTLIERWLSIGTVVVVSKEATPQRFNLLGVDDPKRVMDLIWHSARAERDRRSVEVNQL
jgi:hypothetical protein